MTIIIQNLADLRSVVAKQRAAGARIGFVPTMGNLHAGHIRLVEEARQQCDCVIASIFVNPLQFGEGEDLDAYPRTLEEDLNKLRAAGCHLLFHPNVDTMYPQGQQQQTRVTVPLVSEGLCGKSRPVHFEGVATVVTKLFNMVQPDTAFFGQKDYQQLAVIRKMVSDLSMPVDVCGVPTVRAADGLALSSRNGYLTDEERAIAPKLYETLEKVAERLQMQPSHLDEILSWGWKNLVEAGFKPDYLEVREALTLGEPRQASKCWVILAAAYLGKARLIDNLEVTLNH